MLGDRAAVLEHSQEEDPFIRYAQMGLQHLIGCTVHLEDESAYEIGKRVVCHNVNPLILGY
jgi:hypothetical protein